jgi:hypothetical protein
VERLGYGWSEDRREMHVGFLARGGMMLWIVGTCVVFAKWVYWGWGVWLRFGPCVVAYSEVGLRVMVLEKWWHRLGSSFCTSLIYNFGCFVE